MKNVSFFRTAVVLLLVLSICVTALLPVSGAEEQDFVSASDLNNLYDPARSFAGYITGQNAEKSSTSHYTTHYLQVEPGDVLTFGPANPTQGFHLHGYNSANAIVDNTVRADRLEVVDNFGNYVIYAYTVPQGVTQVRIANASAINAIFTVTHNQKFSVETFYEYWNAEGRGDAIKSFGQYFGTRTDSVLHEKSALFVGDSISCGSQDNSLYYRAWAGRIGSVNEMDYVNASVSGASCSTTRPSKRIVSQLMSNGDRAFDYVILHGGVNDAWDTETVGTVSEGFSPQSFDTSTFAGGLEEMFYQATRLFPNARLGYIINFKAPSCTKGTVSNMSAYVAVAKQICEKWDMPYLNLYEDEEFCNNVLKVTTNEFLPDYIHPNAAGYDLIYPKVEEWMETLAVYSKEIPEAEVIEIRTEAELKDISKLLTGNFRLMNDIHLTEPWSPISTFEGTLDGNGFAIVGMEINNAATTNWGVSGLFGISKNAEIRNLTVYGKITNNVADMAVQLGGIVGNPTNTLFENCVSYVDISSGSNSGRVYAGGIAGVTQEITTFTNCKNFGAFTIDNSASAASATYVGGICAYTNGTAYFTGCENLGSITSRPLGGGSAHVGGILGYGEYRENGVTKITDCVNHGAINAIGFAGGIHGYSKNYSVQIRSCINAANVTASSMAAGICAYVGLNTACKDLVITDCVVGGENGKTVTIKATGENGGNLNETYAGGVFGSMVADGRTAEIARCVNLARVESAGRYLAGVIAQLNTKNKASVSVTHCVNLGSAFSSFTSDGFAAGILARASASGEVKCNLDLGTLEYGGEKYVGGIGGSEGKLSYLNNYTRYPAVLGYGQSAIANEGNAVLEESTDLSAVVAVLNGLDDVKPFALSEDGKTITVAYEEIPAPSQAQAAPEKPEDPPVVVPPVEDTTEEPTDEVDPPVITPPTDEPTNEVKPPVTNSPTEAPTDEIAPPVITSPTEEPTQAPGVGEGNESESGCGSAVSVGAILPVLFTALLGMAWRKREQ